jgi:SWI/SNF-related matrix-associated actin-dependent regulator 1 of chromatin subfamily A
LAREGKEDASLPLTPRRYQKEAAEWLISHKRGILADVMGLGKSCSALTAAKQIDTTPPAKLAPAMSFPWGGLRLLVVCPSYVRGVWAGPRGEISKWWPEVASSVYLPAGVKSTPLEIPPEARVVVIHYDILHAWEKLLRQWGPGAVIIDEAHCLTNERTRRSLAARGICRGVGFVWALTGTPLTNSPRDLWNLVDTVRPGYFGGFFPYALKFCAAQKRQVTPEKVVWDFSGKSHEPELAQRLSRIMLRRTAADVALELPPRTRQSIWLDSGKGLAPRGEFSAGEFRQYLDKAADAKLPQALELILGHLQSGAKCVIFCYRRSVAEYIANACAAANYEARLVHGGISHLRRGSANEECRQLQGPCVLVATIDSSATGIDFSWASVGVFVELTWEPHELLQAEARLHRFGQENPTLIQYVMCRGSGDEIVARGVVDKLETFAAVVGGVDGLKDLTGAPEESMSNLYAAFQEFQKEQANDPEDRV